MTGVPRTSWSVGFTFVIPAKAGIALQQPDEPGVFFTSLLPSMAELRGLRNALPVHPWPGAESTQAMPMGHRLGALPQPIIPCEAMPAGGQFSSFMPSDRPREASTSLISVSDFLPRFGVFSSSTSVFWIRSPM